MIRALVVIALATPALATPALATPALATPALVTPALPLIALPGTLNLPEGALCNRQGVFGTCTRAKSCATYSLLPKDPQVTICSGEGEELIVCCTDCVKYDVSQTVGRKSREKCLEYAAKFPYSCKAGRSQAPRLVLDNAKICHRLETAPGQEATSPQNATFPYMALLGFLNEKQEIQWSCHGSIISDRFVLSTGHCGADTKKTQVSHVAVGMDKRVSSSPAAAPPPTWQVYQVKRFLSHPKYQPPMHYDDVGLVETEIPMKFSEAVLPVCLLPEDSDADPAFVDKLGDDESSAEEKVELKRIKNEECSARIPTSRHLRDGVDYRTQTCYDTFEESNKSCRGSSGRALYTAGEAPCMRYQLAVTAFGTSCRGGVTVYSRVRPYLEWIEATVWP